MYTLGVAVSVLADDREVIVLVLPAEKRSGARLDDDERELVLEEARVADVKSVAGDVAIVV
jgi:hypothetical protein